MTNAEILAYVRQLLQDTIVPYRHSDQKLLLALTDAVAAARRLRPDLFYGELHEATPVYSTAADLNSSPPLDPVYHPALASYVVSVVQASEDESGHLERVGAFMRQFAVLLGAGG
ncbi:MAG: hypothetical protein NZ518_02320 [Dehalococcoidia bacterium]|nr:hypothetical protein [Dehalococcoidia bacterium]